MSAVASWSGGKDSCLAVWRSHVPVTVLLTMFDETGARSRSHGLPPEILSAQARAMGLEFRSRVATWKSYEREFIDELRRLRADGHTHVVFGDIEIQDHRDWEERVCAEAGIEPLLPLWHEPRAALVEEFWNAGFRAVVVCTDDRALGPEYCGREFDRAFVASLPAGVDACGENGEFHTFVYDGPCFAAPVGFRTERVESLTAPSEFGGAGYHAAVVRAI